MDATNAAVGKPKALEQVQPPSFRNKADRGIWGLAWLLLYRPSPRIMHGWRRFLLRAFGAKIGPGAKPYPSARIWAPWNLEMGAESTLGDYVDCYSIARVVLGDRACVSQRPSSVRRNAISTLPKCH